MVDFLYVKLFFKEIGLCMICLVSGYMKVLYSGFRWWYFWWFGIVVGFFEGLVWLLLFCCCIKLLYIFFIMFIMCRLYGLFVFCMLCFRNLILVFNCEFFCFKLFKLVVCVMFVNKFFCNIKLLFRVLLLSLRIL